MSGTPNTEQPSQVPGKSYVFGKDCVAKGWHAQIAGPTVSEDKSIELFTK